MPDNHMLEIRNERRRRGWSLTRVTLITGIATTSLSNMERGIVPAYPGWRRKLSLAFGLPEEELFRPAIDYTRRDEAATAPQGMQLW